MPTLSPQQAAITGRQRPVATVGGAQPQLSPAQAAVLQQQQTGQTPLSPQLGAEAGAGSPFTPNPMADILLGRANRDGPIIGPFGLLGRLAAQGVGQKLKRDDTRSEQQAQLAAISELPKEMQQWARLAVLTGNGDQIVNAALEIRRQDKEEVAPALPNRLLTDEEKTAAGFAPADVVEVDPNTNKLKVISSTDVISPDAEAQRARIAKAGKTNVKTTVNTGSVGDLMAIDEAVRNGQIPPETGEILKNKLLETPEARAEGAVAGKAAGTKAEALPKFDSAEAELLEASNGDPTSAADRARFKAAVKNYVGPLAQMRFPGEAVTVDVTKDIEVSLPKSLKSLWIARRLGGGDPLASALSSNRAAINAPPAAGGVDEEEAELDRQIAEAKARLNGRR